MECIMANTFYSNLAFYFQSPPHRGMECIRDHRSVHLRVGVLSVPSSSGNGVHPPALLYQRHILCLSVPSSSGNGVHRIKGCRRASASCSFSPLLIGEWSASTGDWASGLSFFTFSPLLIGEWSASAAQTAEKSGPSCTKLIINFRNSKVCIKTPFICENHQMSAQ